MKWMILVLLATNACSYTDLRPATFAPTDAAERRGRALLHRAAEAHGVQAWRRAQSMLEVVGEDDWSPTFLGRYLNWWSTDHQRLRLWMLPGTFTSQAALLDGPEEGVILGVQAFRTYRREGDKVVSTEEKRAHFYLPSLHYFLELPFRLLNATHVADLGPAQFAGRSYNRVLATWEGFAPNAHDQYVIWLDPKTGRVRSCRYTVREAFSGAAGTIFYDDYRRVDGVWLAFDQTVVLSDHDELEAPPTTSWFHRLKIDQARFLPRDPKLLPFEMAPGDNKPSDDI